MEVIEFTDCVIMTWDQEWPSRKPFTLNGVMYVVDEWRVSVDGKTHWHKLIDQQRWQERYGR